MNFVTNYTIIKKTAKSIGMVFEATEDDTRWNLIDTHTMNRWTVVIKDTGETVWTCNGQPEQIASRFFDLIFQEHSLFCIARYFKKYKRAKKMFDLGISVHEILDFIIN